MNSLGIISLINKGFQLNSCVGFDSGCVRRQMDNFVHDLISANHDSDFENLIIWGWTLYFYNSARSIKYPIFLVTSGETSGEKKFQNFFIASKSASWNFRGTLGVKKSILAHSVVENPEKHTFGQNCPKYDATVKEMRKNFETFMIFISE